MNIVSGRPSGLRAFGEVNMKIRAARRVVLLLTGNRVKKLTIFALEIAFCKWLGSYRLRIGFPWVS